MLTPEQRNFIAILETRNIEGEHQIPYIKQQFNLTNEQAITLQNEYWTTVYSELKQQPNPKVAGQVTINKPAYKFLYSMGQYNNPKTKTKNFDGVTFIYRITMLCLLIGALLWVSGILLAGWTLW
jgi:hypothetical protein